MGHTFQGKLVKTELGWEALVPELNLRAEGPNAISCFHLLELKMKEAINPKIECSMRVADQNIFYMLVK
jgi:hypothetical protein